MDSDGAMTSVRHILARLRSNSELRAASHFNPPATAASLKALSESMEGRVPAMLNAFYSLHDGIALGSFEIASISETIWFSRELLALHHWGNGDADCIQLALRQSPMTGDGEATMMFVGHDPPGRFEIAPSFQNWLQRVISEFMEYKEIIDPWGCRQLRLRRTYTPPSEWPGIGV